METVINVNVPTYTIEFPINAVRELYPDCEDLSTKTEGWGRITMKLNNEVKWVHYFARRNMDRINTKDEFGEDRRAIMQISIQEFIDIPNSAAQIFDQKSATRVRIGDYNHDGLLLLLYADKENIVVHTSEDSSRSLLYFSTPVYHECFVDILKALYQLIWSQSFYKTS